MQPCTPKPTRGKQNNLMGQTETHLHDRSHHDRVPVPPPHVLFPSFTRPLWPLNATINTLNEHPISILKPRVASRHPTTTHRSRVSTQRRRSSRVDGGHNYRVGSRGHELSRVDLFTAGTNSPQSRFPFAGAPSLSHAHGHTHARTQAQAQAHSTRGILDRRSAKRRQGTQRRPLGWLGMDPRCLFSPASKSFT